MTGHTHVYALSQVTLLTLPDPTGQADVLRTWVCACGAPDSFVERTHWGSLTGRLPSLAALDAIRAEEPALPTFALGWAKRARVQPVPVQAGVWGKQATRKKR